MRDADDQCLAFSLLRSAAAAAAVSGLSTLPYCQYGTGEAPKKQDQPSFYMASGKGGELERNYIGSDYDTWECHLPAAFPNRLRDN